MSFKITIEPSGLQLLSEPGESILDAALRHGINLHYGCRNAVCGACKGLIIEGTVFYDGFETPGLGEDERRQSLALFCRAIPTSDIRIEAEHVISPKTIKINTIAARVDKIERMTPDILCLELRLNDQKRLEFLAGQYIDILLQDGRRRSFSIANAPHMEDIIELHIRHNADGDYTHYIFNEMQENELLQIEGPFGSFYFRENSNHPIIFMAGGTGFGPIKAIIEHALAEGVARPMYLYRGARNAGDLYMNNRIMEWVQQSNLNYIPVLSAANVADNWAGRTGLVHQAITADFKDLRNYEVYSCGPPAMVEAGRTAFLERGLPGDRYFCDAFEKAVD
jgi:CDP-4-dehydro-6-deoxyglucose reductase